MIATIINHLPVNGNTDTQRKEKFSYGIKGITTKYYNHLIKQPEFLKKDNDADEESILMSHR